MHALGSLVRPRQVVKVEGTGAVDDGDYFVWKVTHTIDAADHKMAMELRRNAVGDPLDGLAHELRALNLMFSPQDVVLQDGDIVFIESRDHPAIRAIVGEAACRVVWYDTGRCDGWHAADVAFGETTRFTHRPDHEWYWFPRQTPTEVSMLKCYDSVTDGSVSRWSFHSACIDPTAPADAPCRKNVVVRAYVFLEALSGAVFTPHTRLTNSARPAEENRSPTSYTNCSSSSCNACALS